MYVVTFYSYKGGVGRTMALVNTAFELTKRGRRVLIVDFDLEAPGISTYAVFDGTSRNEGIVDYISQYIVTGEAPDVRNYISKCSSESNEAPIWVMPAGKRDRAYGNKLAAIDWQKLYGEHEGFLMFDDLKQQWSNIEPKLDYVLIDSRTGHTDVGGICTRQLPNAVMLMFYPNRQNIVGLSSVVEEIRSQSAAAEKRIELLFCPSNVPDLDDEEEILQHQLDYAAETLNYVKPASVIHHYNSLDLLNQVIFVKDRPKTRLSSEYRGLSGSIVKSNLEDREGALIALKSILEEVRETFVTSRKRIHNRKYSLDFSSGTIRDRVDDIQRLHEKDGEIAWIMAGLYNEIGDADSELKALNTAIERSHRPGQARRKRALILLQRTQREEAIKDLRAVLESADATTLDITATIKLLIEYDQDWNEVLDKTSVLTRLSIKDKAQLAESLTVTRRGARLAAEILAEFLSSNENTLRPDYRIQFVLSLIGSGQFKEALSAISMSRAEVLSSSNMRVIFNYAMAEWGASKEASTDLLARVIELSIKTRESGCNFNECLALAFAVMGEPVQAQRHLQRARDAIWSGWEFSCWRYLNVKRPDMLKDLNAIEESLNSRQIEPVFLSSDRE